MTLAAATNQATILRAMGERVRARRVAEPAYHSFYQQLGAKHSYTQAAAVGLANDMVAAHEEDEAIRLLQATLDIARGAGRTMHPDTLICAVNLGLIIRGNDPDMGSVVLRTAVDALQQALGAEHPQVLAAARGDRGECDIEPPPF